MRVDDVDQCLAWLILVERDPLAAPLLNKIKPGDGYSMAIARGIKRALRYLHAGYPATFGDGGAFTLAGQDAGVGAQTVRKYYLALYPRFSESPNPQSDTRN